MGSVVRDRDDKHISKLPVTNSPFNCPNLEHIGNLKHLGFHC